MHSTLQHQGRGAFAWETWVIGDDHIGHGLWMVTDEMEALCRKVNSLVGTDRLCWRQSFLATP